ncbi:MAG: protein TolQ [Pseudomonadota bacterium]
MEPLNPEQISAVSQMALQQDVSIWGLIMKADIVVKAVMFALFMASVMSWAIIIERFIFLKKTNQQLKSFEEKFWAGGSVENLYDDVKGQAHHPAARLFIATVRERDRLLKENFNAHFIIERVRSVIGLVFNREHEALEGRTPFLATVGAVAPFVGLFGTVWGIMNSFTAIANSNNTSLTVVAPGIAEALFATALGLIAAIPAVMAYNKINHLIGGYTAKLEAFSEELEGVIARHLMKTQVAQAA